MSDDASRIDDLLAAALRGASAWPESWTEARHQQAVVERALYHGVAAILTEHNAHLEGWPDVVTESLRQQAIAQAMWELRHRIVLAELLQRFEEEHIPTLLLKGSALAYDLYPIAAHRSRGDSDLAVLPADVGRARTLLTMLGYMRSAADEGAPEQFVRQEEWVLRAGDGTVHAIDLHWQLLNSPALTTVLPVARAWRDAVPLPRLGGGAWAMSHVNTLIHTCLHRAMHLVAPYTVGGRPYHGADRLIWAKDVDLLAGALGEDEWSALCIAARDCGIGPVILDGLALAERKLGTRIPSAVRSELVSGGSGPASRYLLKSRQAGRAWSDLNAVPGWKRKLAFLAARTLPPPALLRGKYPAAARWPLPLLHLRRIADLLLPRLGQPRR